MAAAQPENTPNPNAQPAELLAVHKASTAANQLGQSVNDANAVGVDMDVTKLDASSLSEAGTITTKTDMSSVSKTNMTVAEENAASLDEVELSVAESDQNVVKRVVDEVVSLMAHIHESKQEIIARGIAFHSVNVLVELGAQGKTEEQAKMLKSALESSQKQYGPAAITAEKLDQHLNSLVGLEKDLGHVRRLARQQGLDMSSINSLTMIMRQNPGDGGEKTINTFLAYALACDIPLHRIDEIRDQVTAGPKSVLPDIPRDESQDINDKATKRLITDICVGCMLALLAMALLT